MKRISVTGIAIAIVISLAASAHTKLAGVNKQIAERVGKARVKRLPAGVEGVELKGNRITAKAGYKFVKQDDGSVKVASLRGGPGGELGVGEKFDCSCDKDGSCDSVTDGSSLWCSTGTCKGKCTLFVTTTHAKTGVIIF